VKKVDCIIESQEISIMATSEESDVIVDFTNVSSCRNGKCGKYRNGASYSTGKIVEITEINMTLKISKD